MCDARNAVDYATRYFKAAVMGQGFLCFTLVFIVASWFAIMGMGMGIFGLVVSWKSWADLGEWGREVWWIGAC
jgi:hypothetical protein